MSCRIENRRFQGEFAKPLRTSSGDWSKRESIVIRIGLDDGSVGFGEVAPTPGFRGESLANAESFLLRWELGMEIPAYLPLCSTAITCATSPIWRTKSPFPKVETAALIGSLDEEELPSNQVLKVKIGLREAAEEILAAKNLLARMPVGSRLRLDANGALSSSQAEIWLEALSEEPRIEYLEQPLPASEREALLSLASSSSISLALDESVADIADAESWRDAGWPGYFVLKPSLCGDWARLEGFIRENPSRCVISSVFVSPFGFEAVLRMAAKTETVAGLGLRDFFSVGDFLHTAVELFPGEVTIEILEELWQTL